MWKATGMGLMVVDAGSAGAVPRSTGQALSMPQGADRVAPPGVVPGRTGVRTAPGGLAAEQGRR